MFAVGLRMDSRGVEIVASPHTLRAIADELEENGQVVIDGTEYDLDKPVTIIFDEE